MMSVLSPKLSGEFIAKNAKHVSLLQDGIKKLSAEIYDALKSKRLDINRFSQNELHPKTPDETAVAWLFLIDSLNFSFWSENSNKKWQVTWRGNSYTGYFALCAAINKAIDSGIPITDPKYFSVITAEQLDKILESDTDVPVPLLEERVNVLHEVGQVLIDKYKGSFVNTIKLCNNSAQQLLQTIVTDFPCFKDEANFCGQRVALYKRAQILIGDIWSCFKGQDLGKFHDIDSIVMFADYRVPQVLVHFGVMKYSNELSELLKSESLMQNGSEEEVEIRGCSIEAVEMVRDEVKDMIKRNGLEEVTINSILIDHFLWDYRREHAAALEYIPYHKVRCVYY